MSPMRDEAMGVQEEIPAAEEGDKVDAVEGLAAKLQESLTRSEDQVGDLQKRLAQSEEQCSSLSLSLSKAEALASEVPGLKESLEETESRSKVADAWMENAQKKFAEMEITLDKSRKESESARASLIDKERLESEMSQFAAAAAESEGKLYSEIERLKDELNKAHTEMGTLKEELTSKESESGHPVEELLSKEAEITALKDELNGKDTEIGALKDELNDQLDGKDAEILTLKQELTCKDAEMIVLNDEFTGKRAEIRHLKEELASKANEIVNLKDDLTAEIEVLKDNLISKDAEILTLKDNLISKDAEILSLADDLQSVKLVDHSQINVPPPDHVLHEKEVEELKATIKEIEYNNEQTIESFREEILRLNEESEERENTIEERERAIKENKRIIETLRSEVAPPPDDSTHTARIQELEEELATLTAHATAADEWMQSANENFEKVCGDKEELERLCDERLSQIETLATEKNGLQERMRGLEMSVESMMNEKAASPSPPPPEPPAPSAQQTTIESELLEKLAVSEKQRASVLAELAEEKERCAAKLSALAEEVRAELKRLHGLKQ
ncbi:hypothetical protein TrCOL_g9794 [Triparma columacea]|uniref:Uncharacterized protein n=1 Tax=Triparma columacea TaxID=722753 RepID=A0A9W7GG20_9STRA|nr:hypothetical protein TrCOL_g9794 [Triparma columacea]